MKARWEYFGRLPIRGLTVDERAAIATAERRGFVLLDSVRSRAGVMWSSLCRERVRRYLNERRGLSDETIRRWHLGWNPTDEYDEPSRWGITDTEVKRVWCPTGVVIPCATFGALWRVKVRRPLPTGDDLADYLAPVAFRPEDKYIQIRASRPALFGGDSLAGHSVALVVEGEFDTMLARQEVGDEIAVVTLGSAAATPAGRWLMAFLQVRRILVTYDADPAGDEGAKRWSAVSARARICRPSAKDLTVMWQAGHDLRKWILFHVAKYAPVQMTAGAGACIDCGEVLTDADRPWAVRCAACVGAEITRARQCAGSAA